MNDPARQIQPIPADGATDGEHPQRWRTLGLISIATVFALSVWFSTNAIAPALESERGISGAGIAWLTIAVQLGFVLGTLIIAITNLADLMNTRKLFAICAVLAGLSNAALVFLPGGFATLLILRLLTGVFLGGVYPPGMKILSGWFRSGRGIAIGVMIAALTLGSGSPHLLRSVFVSQWELTLYLSSILASLAGAIVFFLVQDGPLDVPARRFNPRYLIQTLKVRATRMVFFGYLGHMWEVYAMWAWISSYLAVVYGTKSLIGGSVDLSSLVTFLVFVAGAAGCVAAGLFAERYGRTLVTSVAMVISGGTALFIGFIPQEWGLIVAVAALVWGASAIADSAQFSTGLTELSEDAYRGTALAFQTGLGFLLTIVPIWLVPILADSIGWGPAFAMLAIGPVLGTAAMLRLRSMSESTAMAMGRR
ncbi:MAG: MFS transporter [Chloroflexi bacterium]|nr:MFS transporter [Chloroflexota bacterium]